MLQASEQVSVGAFGGRDRRIPLLLSPASQSSPEKLLAGYVTSREDSKRECSVFYWNRTNFEVGDGRNISFCSAGRLCYLLSRF